MKTRTILAPNGEYYIQWKTGWFWHDHTDGGLLDYNNEYASTRFYKSEKKATLAMIRLVQKYEIHVTKKNASGVIKEFSSEELKEKFAEHFI